MFYLEMPNGCIYSIFTLPRRNYFLNFSQGGGCYLNGVTHLHLMSYDELMKLCLNQLNFALTRQTSHTEKIPIVLYNLYFQNTHFRVSQSYVTHHIKTYLLGSFQNKVPFSFYIFYFLQDISHHFCLPVKRTFGYVLIWRNDILSIKNCYPIPCSGITNYGILQFTVNQSCYVVGIK